MLRGIFLIFLVFSNSWASKESSAEDYTQVCRELLDYIYKDTSLKNLSLSIERLNIKLALAYAREISAIDDSKVSLRKNDELRFLLLNTAKLNPNLHFYLDNTKAYSKFKRWSFLFNDEEKEFNFNELVYAWKKHQDKDSKSIFTEYDLKSIELITKVNQANIKDSQLLESLKKLSANLASSIKSLSDSDKKLPVKIKNLENQLDQIDEKINHNSKKIYQEHLDDYALYCNSKSMNQLMQTDSYICPFKLDDTKPISVDSIFSDIYSVLNKVGLDKINKPLKPIIPDPIPDPPKSIIIPTEYKNINYKGNYCRRSLDMVDTVVLHHTNTGYGETPQDINDSQVLQHEDDVSSGGFPDPWYMIAYNYLITSDGYNDQAKVQVNQGRPDIIRGAHAGGNIKVSSIDPKAKKELLKLDFQCGYNKNKTKDHSFSSRLTGTENYYKKQIKDGIVNANFTTVGVAVIGNYAPLKLGRRTNIGGYPAGQVRYPSKPIIEKTAKLICELKRDKYKNLVKISDHNFMKIQQDLQDGNSTSGTCCPGTVYKKMSDILNAVKKECPEISSDIKLDISPGTKVCSFLKKL